MHGLISIKKKGVYFFWAISLVTSFRLPRRKAYIGRAAECYVCSLQPQWLNR